MATPKPIEIPASEISAERRTFSASHYVDKNKDPIINFKRETWAPPSAVEIPRNILEHQRLYSNVMDETVDITDADGNPVTIKVSGIFAACAALYDRWAAEDGE